MFPCPGIQFLCDHVSEARQHEWQVSDLDEFLKEAPHMVGVRDDDLDAWTKHNKMVISRVFLWRASDSAFKFLAFLHQ